MPTTASTGIKLFVHEHGIPVVPEMDGWELPADYSSGFRIKVVGEYTRQSTLYPASEAQSDLYCSD